MRGLSAGDPSAANQAEADRDDQGREGEREARSSGEARARGGSLVCEEPQLGRRRRLRTEDERLVATLDEQFKEGARLEKEIRKNLRGLGYGA